MKVRTAVKSDVPGVTELGKEFFAQMRQSFGVSRSSACASKASGESRKYGRLRAARRRSPARLPG